MSAEIENGYFTGYGSLHGANNRVGGFQLSGSHMKTCKDNVEKHVFDITYTWNDIMDPNWEYLSDLFLADLFSTFVSPKDYEIKIQWAKITTILISDKEVKVEGYTSDVSISDITDQEETRECRLRDEGGRCRRY